MGWSTHLGASAGVGVTTQKRFTEPMNPPCGVMFTVAVAEPPGLTVAGENAVSVKVKVGVVLKSGCGDVFVDCRPGT